MQVKEQFEDLSTLNEFLELGEEVSEDEIETEYQKLLTQLEELEFKKMLSQQEDQLLTEADRFDFGTKFTGSFGAGTRVILGRRLTLRLDASILLYQLGTPGGFDDPDRDLGTVPESEWVSARGLTLGLAYRF